MLHCRPAPNGGPPTVFLLGVGPSPAPVQPFAGPLFTRLPGASGSGAPVLAVGRDPSFIPAVRAAARDAGRSGGVVELVPEFSGPVWNPFDAPALGAAVLAENAASALHRMLGGGDPCRHLIYSTALRNILMAFRFTGAAPDARALRDVFADSGVLHELMQKAESAVWDVYRFSFTVPAERFEAFPGRFDRIAVSVDDMEASRRLPDRRMISPVAFTPEEVDADRAAKKAGGEPPRKPFAYEWTRDGGDYVATVGDIAAGVLRHELGRPDSEVPYTQKTLARPDQVAVDIDLERSRWYSDQWLELGGSLRRSVVLGASMFFDLFQTVRNAGVFMPLDDAGRAATRYVLDVSQAVGRGRIIALDLSKFPNRSLAEAAALLLSREWRAAVAALPAAAGDADLPPAQPAVFLCDDPASCGVAGGDGFHRPPGC